VVLKVRPKILMLGAVSGAVWFGLSLLLIPNTYKQEILGAYPLVAVLSALATGILVMLISLAIYRRSSRNLLWYSPLSVYLAVTLYGTFIFLGKALTSAYPADTKLSARLYESVGVMWWGITFIFHVAVIVHVLAYINHRALRGRFAS
jgi:hypothetical protein